MDERQKTMLLRIVLGWGAFPGLLFLMKQTGWGILSVIIGAPVITAMILAPNRQFSLRAFGRIISAWVLLALWLLPFGGIRLLLAWCAHLVLSGQVVTWVVLHRRNIGFMGGVLYIGWWLGMARLVPAFFIGVHGAVHPFKAAWQNSRGRYWRQLGIMVGSGMFFVIAKQVVFQGAVLVHQLFPANVVVATLLMIGGQLLVLGLFWAWMFWLFEVNGGTQVFATLRRQTRWGGWSWLGLMLMVGGWSGIGLQTARILDQPLRSPVKVIAHKGMSDGAGRPNSMQALVTTSQRVHPALSECDVQETRDHRFVINHDSTVTVYGKRVAIRSLSLAQAKRIRVTDDGKTSYLNGAGAYIKAARKAHQPLLIEIKPAPHAQAVVRSFLRDYQSGLPAGSQFHSLDGAMITTLAKQAPHIKRALILPFVLCGFPRGKIQQCSLDYHTLTPVALRILHARHVAVWGWTVNHQRIAMQLIAEGCDGVITDRPEMVRRVIRDLHSPAVRITARMQVMLQECD
ncbi:glycerophosphodiester phosphodiesterase family protein [Ligilactobacillus sp. LYQ60]|uniref:glycerophosphodiester phosphodiesterase family protein n=1 Tax=unclassified Ligilactobacillus TaxID=2767920 RepID=UPI003854EB00